MTAKIVSELCVKLTLALGGADGSLMVRRCASWTLDTIILTTLRLVWTARTFHALILFSGEVPARTACICGAHKYVCRRNSMSV